MTEKRTSRTAKPRPHIRLAADIGGTFTDIAVFDERTGALTFGKALSTPQRLVDGISKGVEKAGSDYREAGLFLHGSTIAINTILERTGAKTALLDHRRLSRHLRDRPHQPAGRLQSVLPQARAAGRAGAALRGQGARARRRRDRPAARRRRDRGAGRRARKARDRGLRDPVPQLLRPRRSRGARQGDPRSRTIPACSCRPRTSCRRNIASSSAARPSSPTPISARRCAAISARSTSTSARDGFRRLVPDRAIDRRPLSRPSRRRPNACACWNRARPPASSARRRSAARSASTTPSPSTWAAPPPRPASSTRARRSPPARR